MLQKKERQKKAIKMAKIVIILINDAHLFNASFSPTTQLFFILPQIYFKNNRAQFKINFLTRLKSNEINFFGSCCACKVITITL